MRVITYVAGFVAAMTFGFLLWSMLPVLVAQDWGMLPLDVRALGYGPGEVGAYLAGLDDATRMAVLGPLHTADTVLPVALALFLCGLALAQRPSRWAWFGVLGAVAYLGADLAENQAIMRLVAGPIDPDPLTVSGASVLTVTKFLALGVSLLAILFGRMGRRR